MNWAYGITTIPQRRDDLFERTLKSLANAGFDKPRLFVDGCSSSESYIEDFGLPTTCRDHIRSYGHWLLTLLELYIRSPLADRYAIFQDDLIACKDLRPYLEACPYPTKSYLNLYTSQGNQELAAIALSEGKNGWYLSNQMGRGAVALVFDRLAAITLLASPKMIERPSCPVRGHRSIDGGVCVAMKEAGFVEYVHNPSLVQHLGLISSMGTLGDETRRVAISFKGEEWSPLYPS